MIHIDRSSRVRPSMPGITLRRFTRLACILCVFGPSTFAPGEEPGLNSADANAPVTSAAPIHSGALSFEERVRYQRRIEQVYWQHMIWPAENATPKPALDELLPHAALSERVATYLQQSTALERFWSRPITGEQLQAEMNRMVRQTRDAELLRELFAALDDEPLVVAECLARPILVDRLVRSWYAHDEQERQFDTWWEEDARPSVLAMDAVEPTLPPLTGYELRLPRDGDCAAGTWSDLGFHLQERAGHTAVWTGTEMIVWGGYDGEYRNTGDRFEPATGTWTPMEAVGEIPAGRSSHVAVWTGTEMIVWGGQGLDTLGAPTEFDSGGRYDPLTGSWTATSTEADVPQQRSEHTAVWTGNEMIVWGGSSQVGTSTIHHNSGGRYDPNADTWTATSDGANVPDARHYHSAVWTDTEMIVWGGENNGTGLASGGRYDPVTDAWIPTSTIGHVPDSRYRHTAVWTGTEMIVWGGATSVLPFSRTGGRYDPATDTWSPTSMADDRPPARQAHTAVWTGTVMIVWGGRASDEPGINTTNTGGLYYPSLDLWVRTAVEPEAEVPAPRSDYTAVWTGTEMVVWGGYDGEFLETGGKYDPTTNRWLPTSIPHSEEGVKEHTAVWTGTEMIVWGGKIRASSYWTFTNTGSRYNPATASWAATSTGPGVPRDRGEHMAVWTGTEMIVWGGFGGSNELSDGGRYNPITNTWTGVSSTLLMTARKSAEAVWTGEEMIIWGGRTWDDEVVNTGGRYNCTTDTWARTSTEAGVPEARSESASVWTGREMIVWSGRRAGGSGYTASGGRYDPRTDSWTATSTGTAVPEGRRRHSAVWTGREMIVWGGSGSSVQLDTGGRYDPVSDSWAATSTADTPDARYGHLGVWTGSEMIVWGGNRTPHILLNTGGHYDPAIDTWTSSTTMTGAPTQRENFAGVWSGRELLVWGGGAGYDVFLADGGEYCVCEGGTVDLWYPDADGDGYGVDSTGVSSCTQPDGYVALGGDCDDTNTDTYPDAPEANDDEDNQCPGDDGYGLVDEVSDGCGFHDPLNADKLSWTAQSGATSYEVARSTDAHFATGCSVHVTASPHWVDSDPVPPGGCHHYLVRSAAPNVGSWGADSAGVERTPNCP